jgi:uncharacterized integral membrane protein (TIGR00697 family)
LINTKTIPFIASMMLLVLISNILVQYPVNYFKLDQILTWAAFTYPITFLVTDLANKTYGLQFAKKIIYVGFCFGVILSFIFTFNEKDIVTLRIVIGSGTAFLIAQLTDALIFNRLRNSNLWYIPPFISSFISSFIDTFLFFFIAFYATEVPWITLGLGDLTVKIIVAFFMLAPFRIFIFYRKLV